MKTYAIGDIHGCLNSLKRLSDLVRFQRRDLIVFLGDYIDRGPDSKGVIEWIMERGKSTNIVALRGNHEVMILEAQHNRAKLNLWCSSGGSETLLSYGSASSQDWISNIPSAHWDFFRRTQRYFETDDRIFVHGKVAPELKMKEQDPYTLIWGKCHDMQPHRSGKKIICGHTPQVDGKPRVYGFGVCIDTGACKGGWLTCLNPSSGDYWQANELGSARRGNLNEPAALTCLS